MDRSPFSRSGRSHISYVSSAPESDISFVSSARPSVDRLFPSLYDDLDAGIAPRLSTGSDFGGRLSFASSFSSGPKSIDMGDYSFTSQVSSRISVSENNVRTMSKIHTYDISHV